MGTEKRPHPQPDQVERRNLAEAAAVASTVVAAAGVGLSYWQNRPQKPEPPKVISPPGAKTNTK
jgi:uncharacterized protein YgbK (DUF1537 family)